MLGNFIFCNSKKNFYRYVIQTTWNWEIAMFLSLVVFSFGVYRSRALILFGAFRISEFAFGRQAKRRVCASGKVRMTEIVNALVSATS